MLPYSNLHTYFWPTTYPQCDDGLSLPGRLLIHYLFVPSCVINLAGITVKQPKGTEIIVSS